MEARVASFGKPTPVDDKKGHVQRTGRGPSYDGFYMVGYVSAAHSHFTAPVWWRGDFPTNPEMNLLYILCEQVGRCTPPNELQIRLGIGYNRLLSTVASLRVHLHHLWCVESVPHKGFRIMYTPPELGNDKTVLHPDDRPKRPRRADTAETARRRKEQGRRRSERLAEEQAAARVAMFSDS